jgi:phosphoribosylaminoimidazole-succinocarboxamide synthase
MNTMPALHESHLSSLPLLHRGKVRDIYAVDGQHLLIVQTDRLYRPQGGAGKAEGENEK